VVPGTVDPVRVPSPTGIAELDDVLAELVDQARAALRDDLVGAYVQGSFALGDADAESDCDFLVVTRKAPTGVQRAALHGFHADLPHRPGAWNRHLRAPAVTDEKVATVRTFVREVGQWSAELVRG
jgi:predicted nucleotidyltransferase